MFKYLGSVRFTITLLILIVVACILGTLLPQNWSAEQYRIKYGEGRYKLLAKLQMTDIYHSYWFIALLTIFCVNLCVCSTRSFAPLVRSLQQSGSTAGRVELSSLPFYRKIKLNPGARDAGSDAIARQAKSRLARSLYRVEYADEEGGLYYFERGKVGRLGPFITHASIVIILIGAILVAGFGFKDYVNIRVGETKDIPRSDFQIRVDDFKAEFYPGTSTPKEYTSKLTVIENGVPQLTKTIEVNYPLKYKGMKFYQSNYGEVIEVELLRKAQGELGDEVIGRYRINEGDIFEVPNSQLKIRVLSVIPDFVIDKGVPRSRSMSPNNPAAHLALYEGNELREILWSFLKHLEFRHTGHSHSDYSLRFVSMDTGAEGYYTGLQIGYHPGLPVIWSGCLIMIIGMFLSFYLPFKRIWVRVSEDSMEMGGRSHKDRAGFEKEYKRLKDMFG